MKKAIFFTLLILAALSYGKSIVSLGEDTISQKEMNMQKELAKLY